MSDEPTYGVVYVPAQIMLMEAGMAALQAGESLRTMTPQGELWIVPPKSPPPTPWRLPTLEEAQHDPKAREVWNQLKKPPLEWQKTSVVGLPPITGEGDSRSVSEHRPVWTYKHGMVEHRSAYTFRDLDPDRMPDYWCEVELPPFPPGTTFIGDPVAQRPNLGERVHRQPWQFAHEAAESKRTDALPLLIKACHRLLECYTNDGAPQSDLAGYGDDPEAPISLIEAALSAATGEKVQWHEGYKAPQPTK